MNGLANSVSVLTRLFTQVSLQNVTRIPPVCTQSIVSRKGQPCGCFPFKGMATLNQLHRKGAPKKKPKKLGPTEGRPFLRAVVLKTLVKKPKKPNSANRKCVRVKLSTGREATAYIPGEGHNLQEHNIVLVRGGRAQDLPGVKLKCVRGKYDLAHVKKEPH